MRIPSPTPRWATASTLRIAATWVVLIAGSWWLLNELAAVLRPLLVAVFLGYVLMPYYSRLCRWVPAPLAITLIGGVATGILVGMVLIVYSSLLGIVDELPQIKMNVMRLFLRVSTWLSELPYVGPIVGGARLPDDQIAERLATTTFRLVNVAGGALVEAAAAGLYLLFFMLESRRFPERVRAAYEHEQAEHILDVFGRINAAIISYLKAKVISSLILAVPVGIVLAACEVRFALLWAVLTFLCNFIPYLGSVIAYSLPVAFAFVQHDLSWRPITAASLLLVCHVGCATLVEPTVLGRAVGLSPLVILAALSVWGLLWGLPGMFLAVPLTVVVTIILDNIQATRSVAKLLSG